jgi:hypothetical protein
MNSVSQTTFWSTTTIMASAIGGVLILAATHAGEPRHSEAADENQVSELEVKVERVATNVENNARILDEVKIEIKELRTEQRQSSLEILRAIEER